MTAPTISAARFDTLLRLRPDLEDRFEAQTRTKRVAALRSAIVVGLVLYNAYNLTSLFLLPDILWFSVFCRLGLVTPVSLGLAWLIGRLDARKRERLVALGVANAFAVPVFLFWLSDAPQAAYTFGELPLTLVFANMLLQVRFRHALLFTSACFGLATAAVATKPGLEPILVPAFVLQFGTACLFTLYANWRVERARVASFLAESDATQRAEEADRSSRTFRDLSLTDALTGLPNRRGFDAELERLAGGDAPLAVLMVDVDHFKLFNDRLGHPAGDACLRLVALCLADVARRAGGRAVRFGGEEFAVLLSGATEFEAARLAGGIVEAVRALALPHPARPDGGGIVTVSLGLARSPAAGTRADRDALLAGADAALYAAKRRGRDGWATAGEAARKAAG